MADYLLLSLRGDRPKKKGAEERKKEPPSRSTKKKEIERIDAAVLRRDVLDALQKGMSAAGREKER